MKPIAWIDPNDNMSDPFSWNKTSYHTVPLYTHPAELTDEEIVKLHEETSFFGVLDPVKFAKAILKRARE